MIGGKKVDVYYLIATVLGLGRAPLAPGTVGSLTGLFLCFVLRGHLLLYAIVFLVLFAAGVIASARVEETSEEKDPSMIVIDEFACIFVAFFLVPMTWPAVITGFILYRVLDIVKIPPMKSLEDLHGGWGIMLDDLMAGIYTNLALHILLSFNIL
ncbi:MAG: phosphatidylglycerophosphatase A [Candidatus Tantalella remota]|nr:phosphatidylglycerophosphatase A [Candidatus Tantalella remota]